MPSIIIKARFLDAFDRLVLQSLFGQIWERGEGGGYLCTSVCATATSRVCGSRTEESIACRSLGPHLASMSGPYRLPGVSFDKRIYIDYGLGDAQIVRTLAARCGNKAFLG